MHAQPREFWGELADALSQEIRPKEGLYAEMAWFNPDLHILHMKTTLCFYSLRRQYIITQPKSDADKAAMHPDLQVLMIMMMR